MLSEVNLHGWFTSNDATDCSFTFSDRHSGAPAGQLVCTNVRLLSCHNILERSDLPLYVRTVVAEPLTGPALLARLDELRFVFSNAPGPSHLPWEQRLLHHVKLQGGYIQIDVLCEGYRLTQTEGEAG